MSSLRKPRILGALAGTMTTWFSKLGPTSNFLYCSDKLGFARTIGSEAVLVITQRMLFLIMWFNMLLCTICSRSRDVEQSMKGLDPVSAVHGFLHRGLKL